MWSGFRPESVVLPGALVIAAVVQLIRTRRLGRRFLLGASGATTAAILVSLPWLMAKKGDASTVFYLLLLNGYFAVPVCLGLLAVAVLLRAGRGARTMVNRRA